MRRSRRKLRVAPGSGAGAAIALNHAIGDTLGGGTVIITGTGFTGATAVTFGGTAASSYIVDSSTQISAVVAAHTAGLGNVIVTTPQGVSTLTNGYEFWSPTVSTPNVFFDRGYATPGGVGTLTMRSGTTTCTTRVSGVGGVPDDASGIPDFVRANNDVLTGPGTGGTLSLTNAWGTGDMTVMAVVDIDSISAGDGGGFTYTNDSIVADVAGYAALQLGGAGKDKAKIVYYDGAIKKVELSIGTDPVTGRKVLAGKKVSGVLKLTQDGVTYATGDTAGALDAGATGEVAIGAWLANSKFFDGRIKCIVMDDVAWSDADISKFYRWAAARHP